MTFNKPFWMKCPSCGFEIELVQFGTSHLAGVSCLKCDSGMENVELEELEHVTEEQKKKLREKNQKRDELKEDLNDE